MTINKNMDNHDEKDSASCSHGGDTERPLKKARYVWQVKGKQHTRAVEDPCKGSCIETFIARTESILESSDDEEEKSKGSTTVTNIERSISDEIPVTLVAPDVKNREYHLRKWQARQIARAYIDNTINSVLESRIVVPFDAEDLVEKCQQDGLVEDEGIMMAIQAHGLQSREETSEAVEKVETVEEVEQKSSDEGKENDETYTPDILSGILNLAVLAAIEKKGLSHKMD